MRPSITKRTSYVDYESLGAEALAPITAADSLEAVSYTHLDVYKRQADPF